MPEAAPGNEDIARHLEEIANALEQTGANTHRISAYRRAASRIADYDESVAQIAKSRGPTGLEDISGVGESLARLIDEYVKSGNTGLHERLKGQLDPAALFAELPGVGEELGRRIHEELGVSTLEELEQVAHEGKLETVEGIGSETVRAIKDVLQSRLRPGRSSSGAPPRPSDELLLEIDSEYRKKAEANALRTIAPKRFNPEGKAWLPVFETNRGGYQFTALYSNTAKAHEKEKTHDWVVIYYEKAGNEGQATVITGRSGKRVVASR